MLKKVLIAVISFVLILSFTCWSYAETASTLQEKKNEAQQNKNEAEEHLNEVKTEKSEILSEIDDLIKEINESETELEKLNSQIEDLEEQIEQAEKELAEAEARQVAQQKALEQRIVAQYKTGTLSYWEILLSPGSPLEFVSNLHMFDKIAQYDNDLIASIEREKEKITKTKDDLDSKKSEVKIVKANAEKENVKLKNAKAQKNNKVAKLSEEEKSIQQKIEEYESEMASLQRQIVAAQSQNSGSITYSGGKFAWPTPGYYTVTSYYGTRLHPIYKVYKLHAGIDLGAPGGANFIAVEDGIVITSTYSSSYGNMVVIDHGSGITTLYAHGSARYVSVGQRVTRGQAVLAVGSTGLSTGNHAHFEVRVNGSAVDPMTYLK